MHKTNLPNAKPRHWLVNIFVGKFGILLAALLTLMLAIPLLEFGQRWMFPLSVCAIMVIVACLHAARPGKRQVLIGLALGVADIVFGRLAVYENLRWMVIFQVILWLATFAYVIVTLLEAVFERKYVDVETLEAAMCIYILIGLGWIYVYVLINLINPGMFTFDTPLDISKLHDRSLIFMRLFLFSFGKLTGAGYDGVTVKGPFVGMCVSLQALSGQIYLAVVIARLVNLGTAPREQPSLPDSHDSPTVDN